MIVFLVTVLVHNKQNSTFKHAKSCHYCLAVGSKKIKSKSGKEKDSTKCKSGKWGDNTKCKSGKWGDNTKGKFKSGKRGDSTKRK